MLIGTAFFPPLFLVVVGLVLKTNWGLAFILFVGFGFVSFFCFGFSFPFCSFHHTEKRKKRNCFGVCWLFGVFFYPFLFFCFNTLGKFGLLG